jgi:hypothetical protein
MLSVYFVQLIAWIGTPQTAEIFTAIKIPPLRRAQLTPALGWRLTEAGQLIAC